MTRRVAKRGVARVAKAQAPRLRGEAYPAVAGFFRGYLHEDFLEVHGSLAAAAAAFIKDADAAERQQLTEELAALAAALRDRPLRQVRKFVTEDLGSRWAPESRQLERLLELLRQG
jgi:hypothetical protein